MGSQVRYKYIDHTADTEFIAYGKTIEEVFQNTFLALFDTISDIKKVANSKSRIIRFTIKDSADSIENLLWFALQDSLSILDARGLFPYKISYIKIKEQKVRYTLIARVECKKQSEKFSRIYVKGISRFDLKVKQKKNGFETSVVVDI